MLSYVCGLAQCDSNYDVATTMNSGIEWNSLFSFMKSRDRFLDKVYGSDHKYGNGHNVDDDKNHYTSNSIIVVYTSLQQPSSPPE